MAIQVNKGDIIWSYLGVIVSFTTSVISLPLLIHFLDGDSLGLWYVFGSVGAITTLFDFGFTVTFARNITYCWSGATKLEKSGVIQNVTKEPDFKMMRDVLYTCKRIYLIISLACFALLLTGGTAYIIHISSGISGNRHVVAWIIYSISAFLNLYYNYYDSFLRGVGAVKQANINRVVARSSQLAFMILFLVLGLGVLGLSIAGLLFGIVFRYMGQYYFYQYQGIGEKLNNVQEPIESSEIMNLFKTVWYNAWRDGLVQFSNYLCDQVSVIICPLYLTLTETGSYSMGVQIAGVVLALSSTLYTTYQPQIQSNWIINNREKVRSIMTKILGVYILTYMAGIVGVVILGLPILRLVKPDVIIGIPVMLGIFSYSFIVGFRNCFTSYFSCTNRLIYVPAFIISSIFCVLLSVLFMQLGAKLWGLILAQIICQLSFNAWYWPRKACLELQINRVNLMQLRR